MNCGWEDFEGELRRFLHFIGDSSVLSANVAQIVAEFPNLRSEMEQYFAAEQQAIGVTHNESAAIGYLVLEKVSQAGPEKHGMAYQEHVCMVSKFDEALDDFRNRYIRPFYEALDENLQDANVILSELIRAKHSIEWFRRNEFYDLYRSETIRGEKNLAWKFYGLLYDRGVEFSIEPTSISGEADMVAAQDSERPLIADIKIFDPEGSRGIPYIKKGFSQVFTYLEDFNQTVGYLISFAVTNKVVRLTDLSATEVAPSISIHGKTIFLIQIDIFPHENSASHRQQVIEQVTSADVISEIDASRAGAVIG